VIAERLIQRQPRERVLLGLTALAVVGVALYWAAYAPAQDVLAERQATLAERQANLNLQKQQMALLRSETAACRRTLDQLAGASEPWLRKDRADALLQQWQNLGAQLGVTVKAVARDRQAPAPAAAGQSGIEILIVRLEVQGPYGSIMAMLARLTEGTAAVGLEQMDLRVADQPPYDLDATILLRVAVVPEEKPNA